MSFDSYQYVIFFFAICLLIRLVANNVMLRNIILLIGSYYFYASWNWRFLSLIIWVTVINYICGLSLGTTKNIVGSGVTLQTAKRKLVLLISLLTCLGVLGVFKYYNFFINSFVDFIGVFGIESHKSTLDIVLPVGISFFTFQTLSYTIDVYRGLLEPERNIINFAVYIAFFPQLVAGPIERAQNLLPQFRTIGNHCYNDLLYGFYLMGKGYFKKILLADNIALVADITFNKGAHSGVATILGMYAFAIQIYCDFSGYTDIARGSAKVIGFDLIENFNLPYFATNPRDFWRRWHISLSTWLRDYLYIPLGGNRKGKSRKNINLIITMLLGGLWHGASWNFLVWGAFHGIWLSCYNILSSMKKDNKITNGSKSSPFYNALKMIFTFHMVCIGWIFFRSETITQSIAMLKSMTLNFRFVFPDRISMNDLLIFTAIASIIIVTQIIQHAKEDINFLFEFKWKARALIYSAAMFMFIIFGNFHQKAFIYFQF